MAPRSRKRAGWAVLAAILLATVGCGYKLVGANSFLPENIRIIALKPFENRTTRPEIEQRVTEEVARELSKRGRYRVVTSRDGADAVLEGAIVDFHTEPVQFNQFGRATRMIAQVTIQATLRDLSTDEVLWSQSGLVFREQFDVTDQESAGSILPGSSGSEYIDRETLALDEIAKGAAGALVTSILEGF